MKFSHNFVNIPCAERIENPSARLQALGTIKHLFLYNLHCRSVIIVLLLLPLAVTGNMPVLSIHKAFTLLSFVTFAATLLFILDTPEILG